MILSNIGLYDITNRLAYHIWQIFEHEGLSNTAESNWRSAEQIVENIINGTYLIDEFKTMLGDDYEHLKRIAAEHNSRHEAHSLYDQ